MYVLHDRMASDVNFKLFYFVPDVFFLKRQQPYLWSWKADTCNSSFSLQGAQDNRDENLSVIHE